MEECFNNNIENNTDNFLNRLLKTKDIYTIEGYKHASNVYSNILMELSQSFEDIRDQFNKTGLIKQLLINDLLQMIKNLEDDKKTEEKTKTNIIEICKECIEIFEDEINTFNSEEMTDLPFDRKSTDWRYTYGIIEKDGDKV